MIQIKLEKGIFNLFYFFFFLFFFCTDFPSQPSQFEATTLSEDDFPTDRDFLFWDQPVLSQMQSEKENFPMFFHNFAQVRERKMRAIGSRLALENLTLLLLLFITSKPHDLLNRLSTKLWRRDMQIPSFWWENYAC